MAVEESEKIAKRADSKEVDEEEEEDDDEIRSFEEMGLDPRLIRALSKKGITQPTPIQSAAIPRILQGKDVVARAKTGSGKTYAYLLPMLQKLFSEASQAAKAAPRAVVLVPTRELTQQVYLEISSLLELCRTLLKVVQLTAAMSDADLQAAFIGSPDILVSTPACISKCLSKGVLQSSSFQGSLSMLVLDEADLLLSYGYEEDLSTLAPHVPRHCQCLLMSATLSADVDKLKNLVLHSPYILTLAEDVNPKEGIVPRSVQQFWISCSAQDKLVTILALLKLELVQKKVLIFVNSINMGFKLRLFLEQFGIKTAVLNAELPQNSRLHILEEFNASLFDYLIATDDCKVETEESNKKINVSEKKSKKRWKQKLDSEFGVVRGIDFKHVFTVINFEMPQSPSRYVHRIGRTGRAHNTGASVSLVSPDEEEVFEEIKTMLGDSDGPDSSKLIAPFPLLSKSAVDNLWYRAQDVAKGITRANIRESRAQDLRNEILNSEKLKAHFEHNPRDLDLLKHDKVLSKKPPPSHLKAVPDYLLDPVTEEARKIVKLSRAAMPKAGSSRRHHGSKGKFRRSKDPLKTFSAENHKKGRRHDGKRKEDRTEASENRSWKKAKSSS
ncbi:DEAD-box ATP-dependent RNA helicase 16-like isoform X1 [Nymphaea colorata]|nr:DEAD-box ATP-dependent RNA helicase 16-like isoform X1 [Nymphaea colorata]XP_031486809.1 DEAD-box ATP-dependent RNA helicase 16-like isoform X1 [Nymphaea colorata]